MSEVPGYVPDREEIERFQETLRKIEFPSRESVEQLNFEELHNLWRKDHELLMDALSYLDLSQFPCLATHGTEGGGLDYLKDHDIPISVWINSRPPANIEEAATMLYGLSSSAITHGYGSNGNQDGGFIVINLGSDYEKARSRMNLERSIKISMNHLLPMKEYPVPSDTSQELSMTNWRMLPADEGKESEIFSEIRTMEGAGDLSANEIYSGPLKGSNDVLRVDLKDCPNYQNLKPQNEIIDGYRKSIALRLESLFASIKILERFVKNESPNYRQ